MQIDIISLFPDAFSGPLDVSLMKRAQERGILEVQTWDLREEGIGKHRRVDERPYGGGPGMVLMAHPVKEVLRKVKKEGTKVIYLSPQGVPLSSSLCTELAQESHLVLLCGHYEGVDERVIESDVDLEVSIGDYVLTNGALAAMVLIDAVARFIPGVIDHEEAALQDSFQKGIFDCPHYSRPEVFEGKRVPDVLLKGNHREIAEWRFLQGLKKTKKIRPELFEKYLSDQAEKEEEYEDSSHGSSCDVVLLTREVSKLGAFYRDRLRLKPCFLSEERAEFVWGNGRIVLVKAEIEDVPSSSMRLKLSCTSLEHYLSLLRKLKDYEIELLKTGEIIFSDSSGYRWIIAPPKEVAVQLD